jgi:hypothetical protein
MVLTAARIRPSLLALFLCPGIGPLACTVDLT